MTEIVSYRLQLFCRAGWEMVVAFGPYVLAGALAGGLLAATGAGRGHAIARRLSGLGTVRSIAVAVALGLVSPLCTYGTVPVVTALLRMGLPAATAAAFLSASSLANPQLLILTAGGLGISVAAVRLAGAALIAALFTLGALSLGLRLEIEVRVRESVAGGSTQPPSLQGGADHPASTRSGFLRTLAVRTLVELERLGPWLLAGILVAAAVRTLVPPDWIERVLGPENPYAVALSTLLGVPFYACGGATIPLLAELARHGVSGGAILAFLWSGPALRITALASLLAVFRLRFVIGYALYVLIVAFLLGEAVQLLGLIGF